MSTITSTKLTRDVRWAVVAEQSRTVADLALVHTRDRDRAVERVLDGDLDDLIKAYLMQKASGVLGQVANEE